MKFAPTKSQLFAALPPVVPVDLAPLIRQAGAASRRKLVVLDDDPTGTQTVRDVPVLTTWEVATLVAEFANDLPCFYVLTNSRSLTGPEARTLTLEIARNLQQAATQAGRRFVVVSRGDSTLRGHYPVETDALDEVLGPFDATVLFPYFEAGGRYTVDDVHYVAEGEMLVPAAETPFARDVAFGYRHSNLLDYVEEKTAGRTRASAVHSFALADVRPAGSDAAGPVARKLRALPHRSVAVVNACHPRDAECFALGSIEAERAGSRLLYRTAAQFVAARLGMSDAAPWRPASGPTASPGGLIVVGSYVPRTTEQLQRLLAGAAVHPLELSAEAVLSPQRDAVLAAAEAEIGTQLNGGRTVVVFTSRKLITVADPARSLAIGGEISAALVALVSRVTVRPRFIVAKGGITSSDVATKGLGVKRAVVRGQLLPGVPVWELGAETRFPGLPYVVFPGNVGGAQALVEALGHLTPA